MRAMSTRFIFGWRFSAAMLVVLSLALCGTSLVIAQQPKNPATAISSDASNKDALEKADKAEKDLAKLRQRESVTWGFVMQHHPELGEVLSRLKLTSSEQYERAVRDIYGTWDRLERMKKDRPRRAELELQLWVIDSRIRLLAARMSVTIDNQYERELKKILNEQVETKLKLLEVEREENIARVKSTEANIARAKDNKSKDIDNRYDDIKREIDKARTKMADTATKKSDTGKLP